MRRILALISFTLLLSVPALALPGQAGAVDIFNNTCGKYQTNANTSGTNAPGVCTDVKKYGASDAKNPVVQILKGAINLLSLIVGFAAIIGLLISSIRIMTSGGEGSKVASARAGLVYSLIGIVVVALAQAIVVFALKNV
ncbi:MAG TPA: hypothetical protein VF401_03695 [Candidatus Saccharimonadales bacterium]